MKNVSLQFYFSYNDHTLPACLPDPAHTYTVGNTCYLSGWGSTARKSLEPHRHKTAYRSAKARIVLASAQLSNIFAVHLMISQGTYLFSDLGWSESLLGVLATMFVAVLLWFYVA